MDIPVLVDPLPGGRYLARCGEPINLSADGDSQDAAVLKLHDLLTQRLTSGSRLTVIQVPSVPPPSPAGILKDNPLYDEWREAMAEYRRQVDADEDRDW
ncbi:MAG TPA: hypothetical protein VGF55_31375 [Gemmataceae bacterium]|jgi:hypothetical protein